MPRVAKQRDAGESNDRDVIHLTEFGDVAFAPDVFGNGVRDAAQGGERSTRRGA